MCWASISSRRPGANFEVHCFELLGIAKPAAAYPRHEPCPENSVKENAANNIGTALIVQRSDRHVCMLPAS